MATHSQHSFFILAPEVAAQMGERTDLDTTVHPAMVRRLHLQFNGWLGDDLLEPVS